MEFVQAKYPEFPGQGGGDFGQGVGLAGAGGQALLKFAAEGVPVAAAAGDAEFDEAGGKEPKVLIRRVG